MRKQRTIEGRGVWERKPKLVGFGCKLHHVDWKRTECVESGFQKLIVGDKFDRFHFRWVGPVITEENELSKKLHNRSRRKTTTIKADGRNFPVHTERVTTFAMSA